MTCLTCNVVGDAATRKTLHWLPLRASGWDGWGGGVVEGRGAWQKKSCCSHTTSAIHQKWKFTRDVGEHDMTICHKMSRVNMRWGDVESPHRRSSWLQILPLFGICCFWSSVCLCKANRPHKVYSLSKVLRLAGCFSELKTVLKLCNFCHWHSDQIQNIC